MDARDIGKRAEALRIIATLEGVLIPARSLDDVAAFAAAIRDLATA